MVNIDITNLYNIFAPDYICICEIDAFVIAKTIIDTFSIQSFLIFDNSGIKNFFTFYFFYFSSCKICKKSTVNVKDDTI